MPSYSFIVTPEGKLPQGIKTTLASLIPAFAGKKMRLTIEEAKDKRNLGQNSLYRGYVLPHLRMAMFQDGDARSLDEWHEVLLASFAPTIMREGLNGQRTQQPKRTREMSEKEMSDFIAAIDAETASRGYPRPIPEAI